jgi:AraC family transcriptional activator of pobA
MDRPHNLLYFSNMANRPSETAIRSYNLFGETRDLPDVVHCETISARSVLHEWEFAPHRHARLHQVLLLARGGGEATIEGTRHRLRPMDFVNVPTGNVHGFTFTRGTEGWVVTLATEAIDEVAARQEGLDRVLARPAVRRGSVAMRHTMRAIFEEHGQRRFARAHVLRAHSSVLIGLVARALADDGHASGPRAAAGIVARFEALVESHWSEHWPLARYAAALGVTPTHLSRLTRAALGCPASHVVRDRLVREARRNLVYTNLPVSTIAYALGFEDPAYFSRVFTMATGLSPRRFRAELEKA